MEDKEFVDSLLISNEENNDDDYLFTEQLISEEQGSSSFADRLIYNLDIRILGRFFRTNGNFWRRPANRRNPL